MIFYKGEQKMNKTIKVNFKNVLSELKEKELKLCFLKGRGMFIEDKNKILYQMEIYRHGSYLDNLIKNGITVEFEKVGNSLSENIEDWEKEIWGIADVESFIKRHL
ncbi:hypothetical protein CQ064_07925 [Bacillus sp. MYb78]|nr:hypothetical protein bthur0002_57030 [Bacillus thuringiensis Bt407]PQZ77773.1 hypothetical protein CQ064_07925 [Bacillus sp. MYb78]